MCEKSVRYQVLLMIFSAPCLTSEYKLEMHEFKASVMLTKFMTEAYRDIVGIGKQNNTETYSVAINYATIDVDLSEEIQLTSFPDFISAVGGNLGLFVGFSLLPLLLKAAESIQKTKFLT